MVSVSFFCVNPDSDAFSRRPAPTRSTEPTPSGDTDALTQFLKTAVVAAALSLLAGSAFAQATATVNTTVNTTIIRPITLTQNTSLAFGTVVRPASGNGNVIIDKATGARTSDGGVATVGTGFSRATYTVAGEGAQAFTITVPATMIMAGPGNITVTLVATTSGSTVLSSTLGQAGTLDFGIGGTFPISNGTNSGVYTGTFPVTVAYN
ncbi:MAG: hypothetical protein JWP92_2101 [Caulobacter sp.]|nr:hypothetical protein [Caulobacter sp.]